MAASDGTREAAERLSGWQPIADAPLIQNGEQAPTVLVYSPQFAHPMIGFACKWPDGEVRVGASGFYGDDWGISHWMPLPAPPKEPEGVSK